ncbi:MAG TPA: hypothetical protein PKI19_07660 [Elusimicrobiales bacterium]|nr:hypothetical protein [Elusimicrobiales bacterium]
MRYLDRLRKAIDWLNSAGEFPASAPPRVRAGLWFAAALCAAFLVFPGAWQYPADVVAVNSVSMPLIPRGSLLLYGLSPVDAGAMPLPGLAALTAGNGSWSEVQRLWLLLSLLLAAAGYSLGCLLAGRVAGVAAAAAFFSVQSYALWFDMEQRFYCLLLALTANALALTLFSAPARRIIEGCAIGAGFLARSLLCWFPPALAALELAAVKAAGTRRAVFAAALALAVPFLFLLPWVTLKQGHSKSFRLFDNRTDWNMVTGALGKVSTMEGDYRKFAGLSPDENAALWAVRRIAAHPREYAAGVFNRAGFLLAPHTFVLLFWLVPALLLWRNPAFRRVSLLGAYLLAVNLAFSSEERYLASFLPLLAAAGAAGFLALGRQNRAEQKEGLVYFSAAAALPGALVLLCMFLLLLHPGPVPGPERAAAVERAAAAHPGAAWLQWEYGKTKLTAGDYDGAYRSIGKAAILSPHDINIKTDLATAALLKNRRRGRPAGGADLLMRMNPAESAWNPDISGKNYALRALYFLDAGREEQAAVNLRLSRAARSGGIYFKLRRDAAGEEELKGADTTLLSRYLPELLACFPPELKKNLCAGFFSLYKANNFTSQASPCPEIAGPGLLLRKTTSAAAEPGPDKGVALQQAIPGEARL